MASLEFYGIISGIPRYEKAYQYYKIAADYNHPVATWAIGYLYYKGHIGCKSKKDLYLAFKFFNKARKLKSSNAYNNLGLIFKDGTFPHINKNINKAIDFFVEAANMGNVYGFNNLGLIYEEQNNMKLALEKYEASAKLGDSWALNKLGELYRTGKYVKKDINKAFEYYTTSSTAPVYTLCHWSKYNLAKYYYKNGVLEIGVKKDLNKAISLLDEVSDTIPEALEELIYIYYSLYLDCSKDNLTYLNKLNDYIRKLENCKDYNSKLATFIEKKLKEIKEEKKHITIP